MANVHIVANRSGVKHDSPVMPDPHPPSHPDDVWQMNAANQYDPPCQHLV
jgi:hypothetical protein